jgi:hypothetical protein
MTATQTLSQIRELQQTLADEDGIVLMALPVKQAFALIDAANLATRTAAEDDIHIHDMQTGAGMIHTALVSTGLMNR